MTEVNGKHVRPIFERTMMRCAALSCRRWVSVGPGESTHCPDPACGGELEVVDMQSHIANLPKREDPPDDVQRLKQQQAKTEPKDKP